MSASVIGIYNRKGGCGKTTATINIAASLALKNKKVLVVDCDSQMNLSQFFISDDKDDEVESNETIYEILLSEKEIEECISTVSFNKKRRLKKDIDISIDVIPGSEKLDYYDGSDADVLKSKLNEIKEQYDFILLDFPPAHSIITVTSLCACDYLLIPLIPAKNTSIKGFEDVMVKVEEARKQYDANIDILGLFYTCVQNYKSDQKELIAFSMEHKEEMGLFDSTIKLDYGPVQLSEEVGEPLCVCAPNSDIAKNFIDLTKEIIKRIEEE